jgi:hypothetical protein
MNKYSGGVIVSMTQAGKLAALLFFALFLPPAIAEYGFFNITMSPLSYSPNETAAFQIQADSNNCTISPQGAKISVFLGESKESEALADAQGFFSFPLQKTGTYFIEAEKTDDNAACSGEMKFYYKFKPTVSISRNGENFQICIEPPAQFVEVRDQSTILFSPNNKGCVNYSTKSKEFTAVIPEAGNYERAEFQLKAEEIGKKEIETLPPAKETPDANETAKKETEYRQKLQEYEQSLQQNNQYISILAFLLILVILIVALKWYKRKKDYGI